MKIINILSKKNYDIIKWTYAFFLNIDFLIFSQSEKIKLLKFFAQHSLVTLDNIQYFLNDSDQCDILLMSYYMTATFVDDFKCFDAILNSLFQCTTSRSYNWYCYVIRFLVFCILNRINLKKYEQNIKEMIEDLIESNDPIMIDSISIILAYFDGIPLIKYINS